MADDVPGFLQRPHRSTEAHFSYHRRVMAQGHLCPTVGQRGKAIIEAKGASSAASAANAVVDTVRDLDNPTRGGFHSVCVVSKGEYGTPEGLITSMPITVDAVGNWRVVSGVSLNDYAKEKIAASACSRRT